MATAGSWWYLCLPVQAAASALLLAVLECEADVRRDCSFDDDGKNDLFWAFSSSLRS